MNNKNSLVIKNLISEVNGKLKYYEYNQVSAERTPHILKERCLSFEQYVECLFNYAAYHIPEMFDMVDVLEGHLFFCTKIEEPDEAKRKFKSATIELISEDKISEFVTKDLLEKKGEDLINELNRIKSFLGGSTISFNSVQKKIKFSIA